MIIPADRMTKQELVEALMNASTEQTAKLLFEIYYKFVTDQLDADYLQNVGKQFGIDLEQRYIDYVTLSEESEDEF